MIINIVFCVSTVVISTNNIFKCDFYEREKFNKFDIFYNKLIENDI